MKKKYVSIIGGLVLIFPGAALTAQQLGGDGAASELTPRRALCAVSNSQAIDPEGVADPFNGKHTDCNSSSCSDSSRVAAKFRYFTDHALDPGAFIGPLFTAGPEMAKPSPHYPREWRAGVPAFGRLYGDALAFQTAGQTGRFMAAVAFKENPSYLSSASGDPIVRAVHALVFTAIDKSDSGRTMPAFSNFVGAASAGFAGTAYLPRGYNDRSHALDRTAIAFGSFAVTNLASEFSPQLRSLGKRLHLPQFVMGENRKP